jgi:branched-chain amino acid transport system substrate-binding protein
VIGETSFNAQGDIKHGAISVYSYRSGKKSLLDVIRM